jgi:hypothetical protein
MKEKQNMKPIKAIEKHSIIIILSLSYGPLIECEMSWDGYRKGHLFAWLEGSEKRMRSSQKDILEWACEEKKHFLRVFEKEQTEKFEKAIKFLHWTFDL